MPTGKNKYSPEEDKLLLDMRCAGKSNYAISLALGRSQDSIKCRVKLLIGKGMIPPLGPDTPRYANQGIRRWTKGEIEELKQLRKSGITCTDIAIK
jgi:hypothetical protein